MTAVMSWILGLQGRCTIKSVAKFQTSMFTGVTPDLVCRGFRPLQLAQYPLELELESELESSVSYCIQYVCILGTVSINILTRTVNIHIQDNEYYACSVHVVFLLQAASVIALCCSEHICDQVA